MNRNFAGITDGFVRRARKESTVTDAITQVPTYGRTVRPWRRSIGACILATGLIFAIAIPMVRSHENEGGLICEEPTHDFGQVSVAQAASLHYSFVLRNPTSHPIHILRHFTSCGCTAVFPPVSDVGPGRSITVPVTVDWRDRDGNQSARIMLVTDFQKSANIALGVSAVIMNPVALVPHALDFGGLDPGPSEEKIFEVVQGLAGAGLRITAISASDPSIVVRRVGPVGENTLIGGPGRFAVRMIGRRRSGAQIEKLFVSTTFGVTPLALSVQCRSNGALQPAPESLLFDFVKRRSTQSAQLVVRLAPTGGPPQAVNAKVESGVTDSPFSVSDIEQRSGAVNASAVITIRCVSPAAPTAISQLRISAGQDVIFVPLVALRVQP
jgi:hypothetical protein